MGILDLRVEYTDGQLSNQLWNVSTSQGPQWMFSALNIGKLIGPGPNGWKIRFLYTPTTASFVYLTDSVALDDISFVNCNPNDYLRPVKCDFEKDICGWENRIGGTQFNWTRINGSTDSLDTGPGGDQ